MTRVSLSKKKRSRGGGGEQKDFHSGGVKDD